MKKIVSDFVLKGMMACGIGPIVLAVLYLILHKTLGIDSLSVKQVCTGIISLAALAFIAGGMNVIYQIERLPLAMAIFIHGLVLYLSYLVTYLLNDWLARGLTPLLIFTGIFAGGYLLIWVCIYAITRTKTEKLNEKLRQKQLNME